VTGNGSCPTGRDVRTQDPLRNAVYDDSAERLRANVVLRVLSARSKRSVKRCRFDRKNTASILSALSSFGYLGWVTITITTERKKKPRVVFQ